MRRSADIALVAGGNQKRWIIATENMQPGDLIKNSSHIGRMAGVSPAPSQPACSSLVASRRLTALPCSVGQRRGRLPTGGPACGHTHLQLGEPPWEGSAVHPGCRCVTQDVAVFSPHSGATQPSRGVLPDDALRLLPQKEVAVALGLCPAAQHSCLLSPAAGTCGVLLRKVNGTAIVQLPSKRHMQVGEPCRPCPDNLGASGEAHSSFPSPRCWRPAWPQWAACPTSTTTSE